VCECMHVWVCDIVWGVCVRICACELGMYVCVCACVWCMLEVHVFC